MINFIIFFILTLILIYVANIDLNKEQKGKPVNITKVLIFIIRFSQFMIIGYLLLSIYQVFNFIFNQASLTTKFGIITINNGLTSVFDWGIGVLILLFVINNIIIFGILEFLVLLLKDFLVKISFSEQSVKRLKMMSNLFVIKIFLAILIHYIVTATLYLNTEQLLIYGLVVVLTRMFSHGQNIQEDSDLSI